MAKKKTKTNILPLEQTDYYRYAEGCVNGTILCCEYVKLACERFLNDLQREDLDFRQDKVDECFRFFSCLKHFKGASAGKPFILESWQQFILANLIGFYRKDTGSRRFRFAYIEVPRKNGKALSIDTKIPTPNGWKTMKDLKVGDYVFGDDGKPTTVSYTTDIMYNHKCYNITFEDGDSVIADAEHNWFVKHREQGFKVKTTEEIYNSKYYSTRTDGKGWEYYYRIPMNKPVEFETMDYLIDPYVLGLWLGDGESRGPRFTVSCSDIEMYDRVKELYGDYSIYVDKRNTNTYTLNFGGGDSKKKGGCKLFQHLKKLGLLGNKHIPEEYLRGSIEQRLELLRGLMDTDGYCSKAGQCEFVQKNKKIMDGFCEILSSLGIKYSRKNKEIKFNNKVCQAEKVLFYTDKTMSCFNLKRKHERLKDKLNKRMLYKSIVNITPTETVPVKCITVNNESHLYLFGERYSVTHNTALISALAMRMLLDEKGAEVILAAPSFKQAQIAFEFCQKFGKNLDPNGKSFKTYRDNIKLPETDSKLFCVASDANRLDGYNPSFAIIDEFHQHPDSKVLNALIQGMNNRPSAMACIITTAGVDTTVPCFEMHQNSIEVLKNLKQDDSLFTIIYSLDSNDNWEDETVWKKAVPNLNVTVYSHALRNLVDRALTNPSEEAHTKTKNFNLWQNVSNVWIPDKYIYDCSIDIDFNDFKGCECFMGIDLASVSDLTAVSYLIVKNEELYLKTEYYLPEDTIRVSPNREKYKQWIREGYLKLTPNNVTDYDIILKDILDRMKFLRVQKVAYDQYNSTQFAISATAEGVPLEPFSQSLFNFNKPTKEFERKILSNTIKIDNNPINRWCLRNATLKYDLNNNCKPIKGNNASKAMKDNKIDGVIAMIQSLGAYMQTPRFTGSIFTV